MNVRINHDVEGVYSDNTIITADQLINEYVETLNETDGVPLIKMMPINTAIEFIADAWGLDITILDDNNVIDKAFLSSQFEEVYQSIIDCDDLVKAFVNKNFAFNETTDAEAFKKLADMAAQLHNYAHELEEHLAWD